MSFEVGVGFLGGTVFLGGKLCDFCNGILA